MFRYLGFLPGARGRCVGSLANAAGTTTPAGVVTIGGTVNVIAVVPKLVHTPVTVGSVVVKSAITPLQ